MAIDFLCCDGMQMADELRQGDCLGRRSRDEVIVIGKDSPRLEFPLVEGGQMQEGFAKISQALRRAEKWPLLVRCRGDKVGARGVEAMRRAMRPVRHVAEFTVARGEKQSGVEPPHSKS